MFTDDPYRDFLRHDAEQEKLLERLPICDSCGEHIQDDYLFEVDGNLLCEECMIREHRRDVEDFMQ